MLISNDNQRREQRAKLMLVDTGYFTSDAEWTSAIADAITDLQHLAKAESVDFSDVLEIASANFASECGEDDLLNS